MELLAQQPLRKANNSTRASKDKAEQARVASVAETGLDAAAVGREEEEECGAKGQGMSDTAAAAAAVHGEEEDRILGIPSAVVPGAPKGAGAAAGSDVSRERGTCEQQAPSSTLGDAKSLVAEVGGKEESNPIAASSSSGSTAAGVRSSRGDAENGAAGGGGGEEGGEKSKPEAAVVDAMVMPAVAEAVMPAEGMLMQSAEAALVRLFDTHDNFFSSDKDEKQVCTGMISYFQTGPTIYCTYLYCTWLGGQTTWNYNRKSNVSGVRVASLLVPGILG